MSHQVETSGIHQSDRGSNLVPVRGLRPLGRCSKYSCHLHVCHTLWFCRVQGVVRVKTAEFIRPKQTEIWPCEGRSLHQTDMQGENIPHPRATQFSFSQILPGVGSHPDVRRLCHQKPRDWGQHIPHEGWQQLGSWELGGGGWPLPYGHITQSLTPPEATPWLRQLSNQQGTNSAVWGDKDSRRYTYSIPLS